MNLYHGDCLEVLPTFPPASVDAIITDLPYGTTACEWDSIIPLDEMWKQVKRVLKPNGAFVSTSSQPFTSALVMSNPGDFRHEWIWEKNKASNFLSVNYAPMKLHESVLVFSQKSCTFNFQPDPMNIESFNRNNRKRPASRKLHGVEKELPILDYKSKDWAYPKSIRYFALEQSNQYKTVMYHPTQKPVALYEYLIRTYTNAGETVLDICMGSGTTGVAAIQTGRNFIGIEKEQKYIEIASRRIAQAPQPLFTEPPRQPTQREPDLKLESGKLSGFE